MLYANSVGKVYVDTFPTFKLFKTSVPPEVVPTDNLYPVASGFAVHVNAGVTETPVAAEEGAETVGQNVFVAKEDPETQEL